MIARECLHRAKNFINSNALINCLIFIDRYISRKDNCVKTFSQIFLLSYIFSTSVTAQGWSQQVSPLSTQNIGKVQFVSTTEGWATAGNGQLIHTTDGGTNWLAVTPGLNDTVGISSNPGYALSFVNKTTGWVIGTLGTRTNAEGAVLYKTTDGGMTWSRNVISPWDGGVAVQFLDSNNGWATVSKLTDPNAGMVVIHTSDGGTSWSTISNTFPNNLTLVQFVDPNNGWILVDSLSPTRTIIPPSQILHTTDGGTTWTYQINDNSPGWFEGFDFTDVNNGWVIGDSAKIFHTTNSGISWLPVTNTGLDPSSRVSAVYFLNSNFGWIASQITGTGPVVLHTTNAGASWSIQTVNVPSTIFSISFADPDNGWLTGGLGGIAHTTTGGEPTSVFEDYYFMNAGWNMISIPLSLQNNSKSAIFPTIPGVAFGYSQGYIVEDSLLPGNAYWIRTGQAETLLVSGSRIDSLQLSLVPGWNFIGGITDSIPVGNIVQNPPNSVVEIFSYAGSYQPALSIVPNLGYWMKSATTCQITMKKTLDPNIPRVMLTNVANLHTDELPPPPPNESDVEKTTIPKEYALAQAYPNPFNPSTTIQYQLPSDSRVSLRVYNLLGQVVVTLVNQTEPAGYKQVDWNASSYASGIYFYRIEATSVANPGRSFTQVKKMILMK